MLTALLGVACVGAPGEIPTRVTGFDDALAGELRTELTRWMSKRDLTPCDGDGGLTLDQGEGGVTVSFERIGRRQSRTVPPTAEAELFAFTVATAAEELVRSLYEAFPDRPVFLLGRASVGTVAFGTLAIGGGAGVGVRPWHRLQLELTVGGAGLLPHRLSEQLRLSGARVEASASATWFAVRFGSFELGPRLEVTAGATFLTLTGTDGVLTQGVTPTLRLTGGAELGFNAGWWWGALHANAGYSVVGAAVLQGTTSLATTRGFTAGGGLSVGVRW